jgi:hypothetical protein
LGATLSALSEKEKKEIQKKKSFARKIKSTPLKKIVGSWRHRVNRLG